MLAAIMGLGREMVPIRGSMAGLEINVDNVVGKVTELSGQQGHQKEIMEIMKQKFEELENELRLTRQEVQVLQETKKGKNEGWERSTNVPKEWKVRDIEGDNLPHGWIPKQSSSCLSFPRY